VKKFSRLEILNAIKTKYGTLRAFSDIIGDKEQNVSNKINRQSPGFMKILRNSGIFLPENDEPNVTHPKGHFYKLIKSIDAGDPALIYRQENVEDEIFFEYPTSENCFCVRVQGDSMSNGNGKSINEGDILLVDMSINVIQGDVVVVSLANGREMVKRYFSESESIILRSDNPRYLDIIVKEIDVLAMFKAVKLQPKIINL
jgi:SOS-response transcriptional repressor LexA